MTTSLSNDSTPTTAEPTSRGRGPWLVIGAVLWIFVGVAAFVVIRLRTHDSGFLAAAPTALPDLRPIAESSLGGAANSDVIVARPVDAATLERWNSSGLDNFVFTERSGRKVTKTDLLGKPWICCFIFTRCAGPCREITAQMSRLQETLKETDVQLVTLTVDPDYDTQAILRREADAFGADANRWLFLTGEKASIYGLIRDGFRMPVKETAGADRVPGFEVIHSTNLMLVDEYGVVQEKFNGLDREDVERLVDRLTGPAVAEIPETPEARP